MKIEKTRFASYCLNGIPEGCRRCVLGKKLVVFISGVCDRKCWYCSLSKKRKNKNIIWINERKCKSVGEMIKEAKESNANGAGITGGDPLLNFKRTIKFATALKKKFGRNFHIHIYLPTKHITKEKLRILSKHVDEARFHPEFLINPEKEKEDNEKIKIASLFWEKHNIGIEMPMLPGKKKEIFSFILKIRNFIGFVNLNEFEVSETNFKSVANKYVLLKNGYVIKGSKKAGLWILKQARKEKLNIKIHFCTAETKNWFQYKNRLMQHRILPYGKRTKDGTVIYLVTSMKNLRVLEKEKLYFFVDKSKKRIILSERAAEKLLKKRLKVFRVEEHPTYDRLEVEKEEIKLK
jgi:uncharacterized protein